ncbi:MAG: queuosine precursor transporter [Polyangiaceae bacterium]|nr:queuosine precursor transporter [Polyangiaceae bacterium]MBK8942090.1 queuosine precursor transporter [Polyangiaceae bacterium]
MSDEEESAAKSHPPVSETLRGAVRALGSGHPDPPKHLGVGQKLFVVLGAIFVTCLVLGDVTGGKAFSTPVGPVSVGLILFPVTFLLTDVINDFYGKRGARFITGVGAAMATLAYVALVITTALPTDPDTYFQDAEYAKIFGGSAKLFVASIVAYLVGQLLDINVFLFWKRVTRGKHLWLRATGSTLISQMVDTAIINSIFWGGVADKSVAWIAAKILREFLIKVAIAILITPIVYAIHAFILRWLGLEPEPHVEQTAG